jgi:hypothetical protein
MGSGGVLQLGSKVVAVPATPAGAADENTTLADWTFYRVSDGRKLWQDTANQLFLAGDRVVERSARRLTVRDAVTGRTLWRSDQHGLRLPPGAVDNVIFSDGRLYTTWETAGLGHVPLLTFDAHSGALTGTTDLTKTVGDQCKARSPWQSPLAEGDCAMQHLDAAGGGVLLVTSTYENRPGHFLNTVSALTGGDTYTSVR